MKLYLVRHAIAEERQEFEKKQLDDSQRPLTAKGRRKMQKMAMLIRDHVAEIDLIISSPYVRALQTADILSQFFFEVKIAKAAELIPQSAPAAMTRWLKAHCREHGHIFIVGHEPNLSSLISYLLYGSSDSVIEMKKSAVCCLEISDVETLGPSCAVLEWLIPPKFVSN